MHRSRVAPILAFLTGTAALACQESPAEPTRTVSHSQHAAAGGIVHGGGPAIVTDPAGVEYDARFSIAASLSADGSAHGAVNVVFGRDFSAVWGAAAGVQQVHVWGQVSAISAGAGGAIVVSGTATEVDLVPGGDRLVFPNEPFEVVITGSDTFTFTWCALPVFDFRLTRGSLTYAAGFAGAGADAQTIAALGSAGCTRSNGE